MKKILFVVATIVLLVASGWATAGTYDLRQFPSAGRGLVVMGSDLPPSWFLDVWVNPTMISQGSPSPQGPPSFTLVPHPSYQIRSKEWEVADGAGVVKAYVVAWERDRVGNRVFRRMAYVVRYISEVPDYEGHYWIMYLGLYELGVRWWGFGGGYYGLPLPLSPRW